MIPAHPLLKHPDENTADEVDEGDEQTGVHVSLYEFSGAVHGSVKVRFTAQIVAPGRCFLFIDETGVEVGFNGHLLARHGVQGESGGNFSYAGCTGRDDDLVENEQNQKYDRPDDITAADDKLRKGADDFTRGRRPLIAVEQNQTGGRHVERKTQQRGDQKQGRKDGEFKRRGHEHACQQNEQRKRDAETEHDVEEEGRHGDEHDHQNDDDARTQHDVALTGEARIINFRGRYVDCHLPDSLSGSRHSRRRNSDGGDTFSVRPRILHPWGTRGFSTCSDEVARRMPQAVMHESCHMQIKEE